MVRETSIFMMLMVVEIRSKPFGFPLSRKFKDEMESQEFCISKLMLEVSISCYGRWMSRDEDTKLINIKSLAFRAILEEAIAPLLGEDEVLVIRGQSLSISHYSSKQITGYTVHSSNMYQVSGPIWIV